MPLPSPNKGEGRKDFMGRCMSNGTMRKEYPEQGQRYAVCQSKWGKPKSESGRIEMTHEKASEVMLWLGSYSSYVATIEAEERAAHALEVGAYAEPQDDEDDIFQGYGYMTQQIGSTAVIDISGRLVTKSNFLTHLFGMRGYDEIANAVAAASQAQGISQILLDIDSPGGAATGVEQASEMVKRVDSEIMPVTAWTGGSMASAAYWIGSSARDVYATPMATVGSIGVIAVHQEATKMMKDLGIKPTVFRSGPYKALGGPYEALDEKAIDYIQGKIDSLAGYFFSTVAENRGRTTDFIKAQAGDGREFFGLDATGVGLIDGLHTLEEVVKLIDTDHNSPRADQPSELYTGADTMLRKKVMTQEAQAAIAAGVSVEAALEEHGEEIDTQAAPQGDNLEGEQVEGETEALETQASEDEEESSAEGEITEGQQPAAAANSEVISSLISQLGSIQAELAQTKVELSQAQGRIQSLESTETGLKEATATFVNRMQIGMGGVATDLSALDAATILAQYSKTSAEFHERFPVGAKAEVRTEDDKRSSQGQVVSFTETAVVNATKFNQGRSSK